MSEQLKNNYNLPYIRNLATHLKQSYSAFDKKDFEKRIFTPEWQQKELKQRMRHICLSLRECLPADYKKAIDVLKNAAPNFSGYEAMFFPDFVEVFGRDKKHWNFSLKVLEYFTQYSSSEFAVRPFIIDRPEQAMMIMIKWSQNRNEHVRRLASEGCRPRLPWAISLPQFKEDPQAIFPILENLKNDESLYVRKSVANNLNDISKDHPELVLKRAGQWQKVGSEHTNWIIKHALRTLLKKGDVKALLLTGVDSTVPIDKIGLKIAQTRIKIGESLDFTVDFTLPKEAKLRIEYAIAYMRQRGDLSKKVFKLRENNYAVGRWSFKKSHSFKEITTRKYYAGKHELHLIINGQEKAKKSFHLEQ